MAYFDSEILAALNWLSAFMAIACLLPAVFSEMLELKPAALAITWKLPPAPRPWMLPPTLRLVSLQVPVTSPPWATTVGLQVELIGVAGAGEDHLHVGPADLVGRAAADALAGAVVERHGAAAGPGAGHAGEGARLGVAGGRGEAGHKKRDGCECQPPRLGEQLRCLASLTDGTLPIDRYMGHQLKRHSISPIRSCH